MGIISKPESTHCQYVEKYNYEKDYNVMKFFNRMLGMKVEMQRLLFEYFTSTKAKIIQEAKRNGLFDRGIVG